MRKNYIKTMALAMALLLLAAVPMLVGCGASSNDMLSSAESSYDSSYNYDYDYDIGDANYSSTDSLEGAGLTATTEASQSGNTGEVERKIIRNANVDIEAEDANVCYDAIISELKACGGYESNYNAGRNEYSSGIYVHIEAELRINPDKLEEFVEQIKTGEYGDVTYCSITSDEVTEKYYDLATRMESKEKALESYYELLEKAESVEDILIIQNHIDELTEDIEAIKGKLRVYDSLIEESTIYINITQHTEKPAEEKEFEWDSLTRGDFGRLIKNGFLGVCNFVWSALQWIVIILISLSPVLLVAGVIIFIVVKIRKKKAAKAKDEKKENSENTVNEPERKKHDAPDYK